MERTTRAEPAEPELVVRVLGPLELASASAADDPIPARLRRLLAGLVVCAGSVVSADRLADVIWGDGAAPANADAALQNLVSRLRSRLRSAPGSIEVLHRPPGYLLSMPPASLDASRFESRVAAARAELTAAPDRAVDLLDEALALWRGPAYAEFPDEDFVRPEAVRLEELRLCAREDRAGAQLRLGRSADVCAEMDALVIAEPLRERPHRLLVMALYQAGRQADALAVARAYRERLADELGIDPSAEMQRLETDVLRQDPALTWQPPVAPAPERSGPATPARQGPAVGEPAAAPAPGWGVPAVPALVGREDELAAVTAEVRAGSLVTLTGPGGVGKTSMALHLVATLGPSFPDGAVVIELATVSTPKDVAPALLTALGAQPRQDVGPIERVVEQLRSRELLLVLDNCEHVVDAAAAITHALHRRCPRLAVLATSRWALEVPDERVWAVPPLSLPPSSAVDAQEVLQSPSARLFAERAAARSRGFAVDAGNAADVAEVCRRLDGLPLAIELAAARMGSLSPAELKERLSWRFRLLHGGVRTTADRHRTLRAMVDWSYELLDEPSRRIFEVLSVFAGSFPLSAAEQLIEPGSELAAEVSAGGPDGDLASSVLSLVDRSMVVVVARERETRYALLETLRAYGRERLEARGYGDQVRRAHAELHTRLAEEAAGYLYRPGHVAAVLRLSAAMDELRAAAAWATEFDPALAVRLVGALGILVEHRIPAEVPQWAERLLAATQRNPAVPGLGAVYAVAAAGARFAGDLDRGRTLALDGLALAADAATETYLRFLLSEVALFQGRLAEVAEILDQVATQTPPTPMARMVPVMGPLALLYGGDRAGAQLRAAALLADAERAGEEVILAWSTYVLGEALLDSDPDQAADLLLEALTAARRMEERYLTGVALTAAAAVRSRHGDPDEACALFRDALEHWRALGDWTHQWTTLRNIVDLLVRLGRDEPAAILHGALVAREDEAPTYGDDADRMRAAAPLLEARLGPQLAADLCGRGRRLSDDDVVAAATAFLAPPVS